MAIVSQIQGDCNGLLHALAHWIEGTMRNDTLNHGSFAAEYMKSWQAGRKTNDRTAMSFEFRYNTNEWGREYEMVKQMAVSKRSTNPANLPYQSLEEFHIFVLAIAFGHQILVISQVKMHSAQDASLQSQPVSGLYLPLNWDPSLCCKFPIVLGYHQNLFFLLLYPAPENEEEEGDFIVAIVKSDSELVVTHFMLPHDDPMELMKRHLKCETFIHCPDNRETAVALPGAKLSCDSIGSTLSVWEAYFSEAEINLRIYYEKEYNPQHAVEEQVLRGYEEGVGVGNVDHEYFGRNKYPGRDDPISQARGPGQCKTPGCPYQQSVSTGDLCVECFNKGQMVNCRSPDCLNKADVGLEGFCKVCHDRSKFQKSNQIQQKITPIPNTNNGLSEEEDHFKTRPDDLNSLAVDTVKTQTDKCMVPECELTGIPKTGDMCIICENVTLLQQYEETSSRQKERRLQDAYEAFVMVNNQGEVEEHLVKERQASGGRVNSNIYDRHAELLRKLDMDHDRGAVKSAAVAGNVYSQGPGRDNVNPAPNRQGNVMPKITVKKDVCATPGCFGVRLTKSELCKTCKEKKRVPRDAVRSAAVPPTSPRQHGGEQQTYSPLYCSAYGRVPQRTCNIRICNNAAAPLDFRFCKQCLEDMTTANVYVHQEGTVEEQGYPGQAVDTQRNVYGGSTSPNYQEQYEATKRSTPPSYNSVGKSQRNGGDDHHFGGNIGSAPSYATVPSQRQRDVYRTKDLERQIRGKHLKEPRPQFGTFLFCVVLSWTTLTTCSTAAVCPENQTAVLGGQGCISCNFPNDFNSVYWFDNVTESSHVVITFKADNGVKTGPGFESGDYSVHQNGSLIIANVTKHHERVYRVIVYTDVTFETFLISLKVIASPGNQALIVVCHNSRQENYYSLKDKETPSCSFSAAKPPVQLEWFEHFDDGYDHVEKQQFNSTENRNGTYNSLATLHSLQDNSNLIHSLVCRATWPLSDWRREKKILVDSSSNMSFSDVTPKTQYMEINTHAVIKCGGSSSVYVVWRRILTNSDPEIIGFYSHAMTETISIIPDVEVSAEGNLIFSSPQVYHEGTYACIYGDGLIEAIQMTSVEILIPPSPPYIQIAGCDDVSHSCVFKENSTKKLTCAVYGSHPTATLEWIAEDTDQISFFNHKEVIKESGETSDTTLSVEYKVSQDVLCREEILIQCKLHGPLSKIMKAESIALISPATCKEHEGKGENGSVKAVIVGYTLLLVVIVVFITIYSCRIKSRRTAKPAYNGVAIEDASLQIGNGEPAGHRRITMTSC